MIAYTIYMSSFIVSGGIATSRAEYIQRLATPSIDLIHLVAEKSTLTIKQVHDLAGPLSIQARLPRLVWIEEANLLTIPAQNALLKLLEEPPANTDFYLTCQTQSSLLATIRSRCAHQALKRLRNASRNEVVWETQLPPLKSIMSLTPGDRLAGLVKRDRAESIAWFTMIEHALTQLLHNPHLTQNNRQTLAGIAHLTQDAHLQLSANCSVGLVTQNFLLHLPKTK